MSIEDTARLAEQIAVIIGAVLALAAVANLMAAAVTRILSGYRAWQRRRSIQGLLIQPTAEETARYSAKLPQPIDPDEAAFRKRRDQIVEAWRVRRFEESQARIVTLAVFFLIAYLIVAGRFVYIGTVLDVRPWPPDSTADR